MTAHVLTSQLLPLLLAQVVTLLMTGHLLSRASSSPTHRAFLALLAANTVWIVASLMEHLSVSPELKWLWARVQFIGVLTIPVAWYALVDGFLHPVERGVPARRVLALLAVPAVTLGLIAVNGVSGWVWPSVRFREGGFDVTRGAVYWLAVVGYSNVVSVWGVARLLRALRAARGVRRGQVASLLVAAVLPLLSSLLYLLGVRLLPANNASPVASALGFVPVAWGMARYGLLNLTPLAFRQVVAQLPDAVVVLDPDGRVVELNRAASLLAGVPPSRARGRPLTEVIPGWPALDEDTHVEWRPTPGRVWELRASTVRDARGAVLGSSVVARDVTVWVEEHARVRRLAHEDALTSLANRRAFEADLRRELQRTALQDRALGVVVIDLDGLKRVNDAHGHARGDALLKAFALGLTGSFEVGDRVYRLGGDEFAVLLVRGVSPGVDVVRDALHRAVTAARAAGFEEADASFGLATSVEGDDSDALTRLADRRMYADKAARQQTAPVGTPARHP
ncbi:histidine kinase N-terminal 7TM domain-containing diguanylate cyclase [Deinococcus pimensis]|uniref:histidine kinase N-terminal 7TM domain-containing diguanylate cyclase n=1 Tax=Deinococcus pimensis TaxID=309888 RepID=UPI0004853DFD|nr:histidine kinase N-terminal 7TM domain-containing protein [Deinococcus pimensis]